MSFLEEIIDWLQRLSSRFSVSPATKGIALSILIGVVAGLGAVGFRWLIKGFQWLFFKEGAEAFSFMGDYYVIILPAIGGLIIGPLLYFLAREAKGEGPPEVIKALVAGGGRIRQRVAGVKMLASAICIGSGGSVGREGPIVQIGSSFGSAIGQWFKLPDEWLKTFVLCGAAGGIAATFNAPVGGVFFALEVLAHRVVTPRLFTVMISAISAEYIAWLFLGPHPSFIVEEYALGNYWEILLYVLLGVLAGLFAIGFVRLFYKCEDIFGNSRLPVYLKPAIGGLFVGIIGFFYADVFGVGYGGGYTAGGVLVDSGPVDAMLAGQIGLSVLIALLFLKMIATSLTLGSGGSGGVFAPSLFIGAALGGVLGLAGGKLFPDIVSNAGAFSLVGMGAFFAAVVQGPITAIVLLIEMTRDISMLAPVMTSVVVATLTYRVFSRDSIYTMRLKRQGIDVRQSEADPIMKDITVAEAMSHDFPAVSTKMSVKELAEMLIRTGHHGFPVVDENSRLVGVVTLSDVESSRKRGEGDLKVEDIATKSLFVVYPDQSLYDVLLKLGARDVGRIPVVDRKDRSKLLGVLRRHDIIRAYRRRLGEEE